MTTAAIALMGLAALALTAGFCFVFIPLARARGAAEDSDALDGAVARYGAPLLFLGAFTLVASLLASLFAG